MPKSRDAFRTISEVAEWLDTPAHVLRFWESKFSQIKPVKRAGGRRYYRPNDMKLLGGIKHLLHDEGMTIKGVQKMMRENGVRHISALCPLAIEGVDDADDDGIEVIADAPFAQDAPDTQQAEVIPFKPASLSDADDLETPAQADATAQGTKDAVKAEAHTAAKAEPKAPIAAKTPNEHAQMALFADESAPALDETAAPVETSNSDKAAPAREDESPATPDPVTEKIRKGLPKFLAGGRPTPEAPPGPGVLTLLSRLTRATPAQAKALEAQLDKLRALAERK